MAIPRRIDLNQNSPAELAIYDAMGAVENLPADERLTAAVVLLGEAKDKVGDYIDEHPEENKNIDLPPLETLKLSLGAIDVLGQLFMQGPVSDGNIISKSHRDELVGKSLAYHRNGWAFLAPAGVHYAVNYADAKQRNIRWYHKKENVYDPRNI